MSIIANYVAISETDLQHLVENPSEVWGYVHSKCGSETIDIDKAWHGIHLLLNDDPEGGDGALAQLVYGGESVGDDTFVNGRARTMSASQVGEIAVALKKVSETNFRLRYDADKLVANRVYPDIWRNEPDAPGFLAQSFRRLRRFFILASRCDVAIITYRR